MEGACTRTSLTTSISGRREDRAALRSRSNAAASSIPSCSISIPLARSIRVRWSNAVCNCSASRPLTWAPTAWLSRVAASAAFSTDARMCCSRSLKPGQVVALDLVEVGEDDVQLAGVAGDRDALEGGDRGRLHRLGGVVDQQHRGDATSVAPRDAAPEHNVAAGRRAGLARQRLKRLRPTNRVRPVQGCARGRAPVHAPETRSPLRSSTGGGGVAPPGQLTGDGTHTRKAPRQVEVS